MKRIVAYVRVSTSQQGRSGLGIEAQRETLSRFACDEGFEIAAELVEVETGKGSDALDRRPQLAAALAKARALRSSVVVAKLDRLSRQRDLVPRASLSPSARAFAAYSGHVTGLRGQAWLHPSDEMKLIASGS